MGGPEKVGRPGAPGLEPGADALGPGADARLLRAYELLRSVFGNGAAGPWADGDGEPAGPWQPLPGPLEGDPWLVSATDLLVPWLPARQAIAPVAHDPWHDPWQGYFAAPDATAAGADLPAVAATAPVEGVEGGGLGPIGMPGPFGPLGTLGPPGELEEPLAPGAAEAAAGCLYGFLRACGRLDVEAAMALVADDYHAIEADREVDRAALRHRLEALLDERRDGEIEVSAGEPLEPIPFVDGLVLIPATVAIDRRPPGGPPATLLYEWVAVLAETVAGWRICALSPRRESPAEPLPAGAAADPEG